MESLYLLIPLSVLAVGVAVWFFLHMSASGQFDDDQGPAWSILLDDDAVHDDVPAPSTGVTASAGQDGASGGSGGRGA